jgi:hypothetical protein
VKVEVVEVPVQEVVEVPFVVGGVYESRFTTVRYVLSTVPEILAGSTKTHALTSLGSIASTFLYSESQARKIVSAQLCYIPGAVLRIPSKEAN